MTALGMFWLYPMLLSIRGVVWDYAVLSAVLGRKVAGNG